jgi:methyl-accepting chemotaxis protein
MKNRSALFSRLVARLKNGIGLRLLLSGVLLGALLLILGAFSAWRLQMFADRFVYVLDGRIPGITAVQEVLSELNQLGLSARNAIIFSDEQERTRHLARLEEGRARIGAKVELLQKTFAAEGEASAKLGEEFATHSSGVLVSLVKFGRTARTGDTAAASAVLKTVLEPKLAGMTQAVETYQTGQLRSLNNSREEVLVMLRSAMFAIVAIIAAGFVGAALFMWRLTRSITVPLAEAVGLGQAIAQGDLTVHSRSRCTHEAGRVLDSLDAIVQQVGPMVSSIRTASDMIHDSAREIAQGNNELATRAEQQSQRVSASTALLQEVQHSIEHNARSATEADSKANSASSLASEGEGAIRTVVANMQALSQSSGRISEITNIIDGIAFQTNILALNAAVEAARAGDHGRGFAVVAGEVRTLAQRSASAAKEIRGLIGTSVEQVMHSTKQVEALSKKMDEIAGAINTVGLAVTDISRNSVTQRSSVERLSTDMSELDRNNAQNMSLVERIAQMSEALNEMATDLSARVSVFRVDPDQQGPGSDHIGNGRPSMPALRHAA